MKVSFSQILKKTPDVIRHIRSTLIYTIAGSLPFADMLSVYFNTDPLGYSKLCGFAILGVKAVSMLFGVSDVEEVKQAIDVIDERIEAAKTDGEG